MPEILISAQEFEILRDAVCQVAIRGLGTDIATVRQLCKKLRTLEPMHGAKITANPSQEEQP